MDCFQWEKTSSVPTEAIPVQSSAHGVYASPRKAVISSTGSNDTFLAEKGRKIKLYAIAAAQETRKRFLRQPSEVGCGSGGTGVNLGQLDKA